MASSFVMKSVDKYAELYQSMYKIAVEWDTKQKKLVYVTAKKQLVLWNFIFRSAVLFGTASSVFLTLKPLYVETKDFPRWKIIIMATLSLLGGMTSYFAFALSRYGADMVYVWNSIMKLAMATLKKKGNNAVGYKSFHLSKTKCQVDLLGTLMLTFFYSMFVVAFILPVLGVYENLDPFLYIIQEFVTPIELKHVIIITTIRLLLSFACIIETARMCSILIILGIVLIIIINDVVIYLLMRFHNRNFDYQKVLNIWNKVQVLNAIIRQSTGGLMAFSLGTCFVTSIIANFSTVKLSNFIPMPVFLTYPYLSIVLPIIFIGIISHTCKLYEQSSRLLEAMKRNSNRDLKNKKTYSKILKAFQPLSIDVGINGFRLFISKRSLKLEYYSAVIHYTITAFLSIPVDKLL